MNINDYLDPVALAKPKHGLIPLEYSFGHNITIHTPDNPVKSLNNYKLAIIGIPEDRNSMNTGAALAPNAVREKLYTLAKPASMVPVIDLGNLKIGTTPEDTYFGFHQVLADLMSRNIVTMVIGGTQDLTFGASMAFQELERSFNIVTVDSHLDMDKAGEKIHSGNYLNRILTRNSLANYTNIGHQTYFVDPQMLEHLSHTSAYSYRLGVARSNINNIEPILRDAHLVSFDIGALRQSEAPARICGSPNGFNSEEACLIGRYSGLGSKISIFGLFEINPQYDNNALTCHLTAQILWFFVEGYSQRILEDPQRSEDSFRKFIVSCHQIDHAICFYKSERTNRWWVEVPLINSKYEKVMISCSYEDYQNACRDQIPDRWIHGFNKFN